MAEYKILTPPPRNHRALGITATLVVVVAAVAIGAFVVGRHADGSDPSAGARTASSTTTPPVPLTVVSTTPASGAVAVPSDQTVTVQLSSPVSRTLGTPTFVPPVAGTWTRTTPTTLTFQPTAPFIPTTTETLTIPNGAAGPHATSGGQLAAPVTVTFTVDQASTERLQQLLAQLGYLPLSFTPTTTTTSPAATLTDQTGTFAWKWPSLPASLTSLWTEGSENAITKGALMNFQNQNGLTVDGLAGTKVWSALIAAVAANKTDANPYTYVHVSKQIPQTLDLYENGAAVIAGLPVNTGAPGADTADGTFEVFEHVPSSRMRGTNPDGSTYDDPDVPWASYFNGGDALHGFVRSSYGTPQSNGCVEMAIANAARVWPLTPIGTLVTVEGPAS